MKYYFVEPVCYCFSYSPIIGIPSLIAILEQNNYEAKHINLNIDFINKCLNEDFYKTVFEKRYGNYSENIVEAPCTIKEVLKVANDIFQKKTKISPFNSKKNNIACKIFKNKKYFLNRLLYEFAYKTINSLPVEIGFLDNIFMEKLIPDVGVYRSFSEDEKFSIDVESLKYYFENKISPIDSYIEEKADEIIAENPDCVGISIGYSFSFISGFLLAYKLKQKSRIHVNIGGSFFNDFYRKIYNLADLFGIFFDSISIGDNTCSVVDLMKYLSNKIELSQVANILYLEDGTVTKSSSEKSMKFKDLPFQSFTGYDFKNYINPEIIMPIQASSTCYWGKCIFCMYSASHNFQIKPVENVVNEMEYLANKYGVRYFNFWDNSLHPIFLSKLSSLIIKRKLNVRFSIYARFEKDFNYKLLKKMKKAGCIKIHWGLDATNQRVLDYINKGIQLDVTSRILKEAKKAGIYNFVYLIFGHPTETKQEMESVYSYLKKNRNYISRLDIASHVLFCTNSILERNREKYKKLIYTTPNERRICRKNVFEEFSDIQARDYCSSSCSDEAVIPMILYVDKYGTGIKSHFYSVLHSFLISNKRLLSLYMKFKLKQIQCDNTGM